MKLEKQHIPVFVNDNGEAIGILFFNKNRERVIYIATEADEEEIISLINDHNGNKETKDGDSI